MFLQVFVAAIEDTSEGKYSLNEAEVLQKQIIRFSKDIVLSNGRHPVERTTVNKLTLFIYPRVLSQTSTPNIGL